MASHNVNSSGFLISEGSVLSNILHCADIYLKAVLGKNLRIAGRELEYHHPSGEAVRSTLEKSRAVSSSVSSHLSN